MGMLLHLDQHMTSLTCLLFWTAIMEGENPDWTRWAAIWTTYYALLCYSIRCRYRSISRPYLRSLSHCYCPANTSLLITLSNCMEYVDRNMYLAAAVSAIFHKWISIEDSSRYCNLIRMHSDSKMMRHLTPRVFLCISWGLRAISKCSMENCHDLWLYGSEVLGSPWSL